MKAPDSYSATLTLLGMLVIIDLLFMGVHVVHAWTPWLDGGHYSIEADRGLAEIYQYIKEFWVAACMAAAFLMTRIRAFLGWSALFAFLLLDDAAQIHERVGYWLGQGLGLRGFAGLRADDFGELLFAGLIGLLTFAMIAHTLFRGEPTARRSTRDVFLLVGTLAFFGVAVDAVHVISYFEAPLVAPLLALIEDGGEMVVVSMLTCYAFDVVTNDGRIRIDCYQAAKTWWSGRGAVNLSTDRLST
ncbi:MAG: hypothetical protein AB7I04_13065 [Pseudomonadales bacterium]